MTSRRSSVVIVGAGIVGASMAYHLARLNVGVTLVDRGKPAGGVTHRSFAWINVSHGLPEAYPELRKRAIGEWHRLESELSGRLRVNWSGALTWHADPFETERLAHDSAAMGHDLRLIRRDEIAALEPNLKNLPDSAAFASGEGAVDPVAATETLVQAAREAGAGIRLDSEVLSLSTQDSGVTGVVTSTGKIEADAVVLAAGVGAKALSQPLGLRLPLDASPCILMRFRTPRRLVNRVVCNQHMEIRPHTDTIMVGAEDYIDASGENGPEAVAARALAAIRKQLTGGEDVELMDVQVGIRPVPRDGLPIVGRVPGIAGLYLSVMHVGVMLAPLVGRLASLEIAHGMEDPLLAPYRSNRF
ncbi:FAD-binding oxidoreductase [Mesorhizobium sp. CGMCC 1.15528]|uniref:FAD-binding oxidoreductase n=1 Tax=Mesorhizobium zhangyense TaxID=1776730 RepID=A0A7C9VC65_9HYPH|nr:FAD-binding oxidoreductase [Mesorhizobium zhangyense]NGN43706.1 FAD-binding oxidoreductase [Mesorhizobium zhangyense]